MNLKSIKDSLDSLNESNLKFTFTSIGRSLLKLGVLILTLLGQLIIKMLYGFYKLVKKYPMAVIALILIGWIFTYVVMSWNYHSLQDKMSKEIMNLQDSIEAAELEGHAEGYRAKELEDISNADYEQSNEIKAKTVRPKKVEIPKVEKDPMEEVKVEPVKNENSNKTE